MTKLSDHISGGKRIVEGATFDPEHLEVLATFCYEAVGDYDWDRDECTTRPRKGWIVRNPHGTLYAYEERVLDEKIGGDPSITVETISIEDAVSYCYEFNAKILVEFFVSPRRQRPVTIPRPFMCDCPGLSRPNSARLPMWNTSR